jgi:hypothetical protein
MNIKQQLQWNPLSPFLLLILMSARAWHRGFPSWSIIPIIVVALWLALAIYRFVFQKKLKQSPLPVLSDEELSNRIGKDWYDRYSLSKFGACWVSDLVFTTSLPITILFRDEPDKELPSSGWTIITGMEEDWRIDKEIELADLRRVLRQRPELAQHLNLAPGTTLLLTENGTYEVEKD